MYAISLGTGQSITVGNASAGNSVTYSGVAGGLIVVLTEQQYYMLPRATDITTGATAYTDLSNPSQNVLDISINQSSTTIATGRLAYLGFSVKESTGTATAGFILSDTAGSQTNGVYTASVIETVDLAANESAREFYPLVRGSGNDPFAGGGVNIYGALTVTNPSGSFAGVVRLTCR